MDLNRFFEDDVDDADDDDDVMMMMMLMMMMGEGRAWEVTWVMESVTKNENPLCRGMVGKIKSNRVAMARHGPIFGQNEAYHLQEAF